MGAEQPMNCAEMSTNSHVPRRGIAPRCLAPGRLSHARTSEDGFTIVEVLVSAIVVVMIALAAFGAIQAAGRTASETRFRTQAYAIAQQDQAILRTLKISTLSNYNATRTVRADGTTFTVASTGEFITDATGTQSCSGSVSADYISISSTVTWPSIGSRPPVVIKSIVAPPNGTIGKDRGALAIKAVNSRNTALSGLRITGTGPASFTDITDTAGCVLFGNLVAGNYTVTPSSSLTLVDKDGNAPRAQTTSVVAESTNSVTLQYDRPGTVNLSFRTRINGALVASSADTVMAFNSGMSVPRRYGTLNTRVPTLAVGPLFPFTSPDSFYAGACSANNPTAAAPVAPEAATSLLVPVNGSTTGSIVLPALHLTVRDGSSATVPGLPVAGARVTLTDRGCGSSSKRVLTTNATGNLPDPGLPYGSYDVCASTPGTTPRRLVASNIAVKDTATGTTLTMYLNATGSVAGACP